MEITHRSIDPVLAIGSIATLWYNWETIKRLKRQPSQLNKVNILIGVIVLIFAAIVAANGFYTILQAQTINPFENLHDASLFLSAVQITIGFSNLLLTAKTIRIYSKNIA
jgi:hypothetical protein